MIVPILLHICIGLGGMCAGYCGRKFCRCQRNVILVSAALLLADALVSVLIIDRFFE